MAVVLLMETRREVVTGEEENGWTVSGDASRVSYRHINYSIISHSERAKQQHDTVGRYYETEDKTL